MESRKYTKYYKGHFMPALNGKCYLQTHKLCNDAISHNWQAHLMFFHDKIPKQNDFQPEKQENTSRRNLIIIYYLTSLTSDGRQMYFDLCFGG